MARASVLLSNFTGGEVSPRIWARPDVTKVANGLKYAENCIISIHGGAYKRPGTKFVIQLKDTSRHRFIKFQFSVEQSYTLIFGNNYVWFCKDQGIITHDAKTITGITAANPAVVTSAGHGFSNGDRVYITGVSGMSELNNRHFVVANVATNTFELTGEDSTDYDAYVSGGGAGEIVELATTYDDDQIHRVQVTQIRDDMYICHPEHPIRLLTRSSDTSWSLTEISPDTGPFRTINSDAALTMVPSGASTSVSAFGTYTVGTTFTMTAASAYFTSGMVGAFFRLFEEGGGTGIPGAALGDSTKTLQNGDAYTYQGNVYGIFNVVGATTWEKFNRVPEHTQGITRVIGSVAGGGTYFDSYFLHPGYCVVQITAYSSSTSVTARVVRYQMPNSIATSGTSFWEEGAWSDYRGYPNAITLYEQRMWLAGSTYDPVVVWGSRSGAYQDFEDGAEDDDAVTFRLPAGQGDVIRWLSGRRVLTAGTSGGEFAISASSQQEAITPSNVKATQQADVGSSNVLPVFIDQAVLYPEREGNPSNPSIRLREFAYSFTDDRFNSVDLTVFSEHVFGDGIQRIAYARTPERLIWAVRTDGILACCTYQREQEVIPWHRHILGGSGFVQEIEVKPGADGDELWMQVDRTIDGTDVSYVEVMTKRFRENVTDKEDAIFLDSSLTYNGVSTDSLSGLWHLRGETVKLLINGAVETATVGLTGKISDLPGSGDDTVTVGYPYSMVVELQEIDVNSKEMSTAQSRAKRISQVWVRVLDSLGGTAGPSASRQKPLLYRTESMAMDTSPDLKTGYVELNFDGGWDRELSIRFEHDEPLPFHLIGIVAEMSASG